MTNLEVYSEAELLQLRSEFQRVGENLYLDHAGTTLYSEKQVENASKTLKENLFCNPHTCKVTGDLVDQVRYRILQHFNTDANQYAVIFTSNATAALKLVAETFCFNPNEEGCGSFYYCQENHTSVLGMRELVKTQTQYVLTKNELLENLKIAHNQPFPESKLGNSLVSFSAQCNFSGYKMPLELIDIIHKYGLQNKGKQILGSEVSRHNENFFVCLDSASFVATNFLDLQKYKPDFCCISFYKIFGFPTGVGALLVSKRGQSALQKNYYGGGTVKIAMTRRNFHAKRDGFVERFEDGTLPFLSIASVLEGFRTLERLVPATPTQRTQDRISAHVFQLAKYCYHKLEELRHINGAPLIKFYNHMGYNDIRYQGGIVTFNIMHDVGTYVGFAEVACIAAVYNLILRTGCFCNPGACQWFLSLSDTDILKQYDAGHICSDYNDLVDGQPTGAVRLSFGYMTQIEDLEMAIKIIRDCYLTTSIQRLRLIESSKLPRALEHIPKRLRPQLKAICIYPIKSCGGFTVYDSWPLTRCGLQFDRNWMIVDANNMVLTQKHHARLCLIKPTIHLKDGLLELTFPEMESITVPIAIENNEYNKIGSTLCQSKVCNDLIEGVDCGLDVGKWLSKVLDVEGVRLVKQNAGRQADDGSLKDISLVNQAQLLLINKSSVWWLANKVESNQEPLQNTIDRFRANFIIETTEPFDENSYEEFQIGENRFKTDGFCTRCQMICIDQNTGQKTAEPLRTIAREFKGKIRFGIYLGLKNLRENQIVSCVDLTNVIRRSSENNL